MKQWAINCLACYGAYCLVRDYIEENYGIEIVVHNKKKDIVDPEVVEPKKKKWAVTFSR
jgi:hypothetical protein